MFDFVKGFNANVWILMILELFERLAYYGTTFTLSTYSMYMLDVSMSTMNILVNLMYVLSPVAALIGGGMSDGTWGRKWVLLFGSVVYTAGLAAVASSAMPWFFAEFPQKPSVWAIVTLCAGLALLSVGYGCMKVCLAPLLADCALVSMGRCCTAATCGNDDEDKASSAADNKNEGGNDVASFVPVTVSGRGSRSGSVPQHNGCQCGCQEGGVCACNAVVTEERNKAYEHVIGNARQSLLLRSGLAFAPRREGDGSEGGEVDGESNGYGSGATRGGGGCCGGGSRKKHSTALNVSAPTSASSNKTVDDNSNTHDSQRNSKSPLMANASQTEPTPQEKLEHEMEGEATSLLSRLFRFDYFVINFGSIIGIAGAPFLRDADPRTRTIVDEDDGGTPKEVHVGYYIAFWACAASTLLGTIIYVLRIRKYPMNQPSRTMLIAKVIYASFRGWRLFGLWQRGEVPMDVPSLWTTDKGATSVAPLTPPQQQAVAAQFYDTFLSPHSQQAQEWVGPSFIRYAQFEGFAECELARGVVSAFGHDDAGDQDAATEKKNKKEEKEKGEEKEEQEEGAAWLATNRGSATTEKHLAGASSSHPHQHEHVTPEEAKAFSLTLALCAYFSPLPVYWLLATQFSSNVVMQSGWMDMPASLPPEIFNNVNTATILVLIPIMDIILARRGKGGDAASATQQRLSVVGRMVAGFLLMFVSMLFCAVLQLIIAGRGTFVSDSNYVLNKGESLVSALWLVIPFVLQGAAAVFVDTTSIEAAYTAAPTNMKSTVMAVYLLASAASGFLGLAFSPFISAENMSVVMLVLCGMQLAVTLLFWVLSRGWDSLCCCRRGEKGSATTRRRAVLEELHA